MRKYTVFRNAQAIHDGGLVWKDSESPTCVYYSVKDINSEKEHIVKLEYDQEKGIMAASCDCTINAIKKNSVPLCSHIMAVIKKATYDYGRSRREYR